MTTIIFQTTLHGWCGYRKRPNTLYERIGHLCRASLIHPLISYNYVKFKTDYRHVRYV